MLTHVSDILNWQDLTGNSVSNQTQNSANLTPVKRGELLTPGGNTVKEFAERLPKLDVCEVSRHAGNPTHRFACCPPSILPSFEYFLALLQVLCISSSQLVCNSFPSQTQPHSSTSAANNAQPQLSVGNAISPSQFGLLDVTLYLSQLITIFDRPYHPRCFYCRLSPACCASRPSIEIPPFLQCEILLHL